MSHAALKINNYTHATSPLRRIVDLMNQESFYTGHHEFFNNFVNNNQLDYINNYNNNLKKAYRDINKLVLADKVYKTNEYSTQCYIYDVKDNKVYLYFPNENLSIKTSIIHRKLDHIYKANIESENLVIRDTDNTSLSIFQLNKIHNVKINGKPNIYYPDKSIVIQFKNINME